MRGAHKGFCGTSPLGRLSGEFSSGTAKSIFEHRPKAGVERTYPWSLRERAEREQNTSAFNLVRMRAVNAQGCGLWCDLSNITAQALTMCASLIEQRVRTPPVHTHIVHEKLQPTSICIVLHIPGTRNVLLSLTGIDFDSTQPETDSLETMQSP